MPDGLRVTVNCAVSIDGKLALAGGKPLRLSSEEDFARVHRLRHEHDGILVGVGTVLADDPSLLVKPKYLSLSETDPDPSGAGSAGRCFDPDPSGAGSAGRGTPAHPLRVILDSRLRTPRHARVLDGRAGTLLAVADGHARLVEGAEVVECGEGRVHLPALLERLRERGLRSLMVEGGGTVIHAFLRAGLVDDLFVYVAPVVVGGGAPSLAEGEGATREGAVTRLRLVDARPFGEGVLQHWRPDR